MTLKDIAELCGVSISTVSRVVNAGQDSASGRETSERIWRVVHETGYIANKAAQSLKLGQSAPARPISLACLFARSADSESNQFFIELFHIIEQECAARGMRVFSVKPHNEGVLPEADGAIVLGRSTGAALRVWQKKYKSIVCAGLNVMPERLCDEVVCDGFGAAQLALSYLISLGHRRIAYIGEQSEEARWRGYFGKMRDIGEPPIVYSAAQSIAGGRAGAAAMLGAPVRPTAVFCANDITAIGVMRALRESGVSVPGQMSLVSIDNTLLCEGCSPMLTSINVPKEDLARLAVLLLQNKIEGGHSSHIRVDVPFALVKRQSCAKI